MNFYLFIIILTIIYLFVVNFTLKKLNICLDKEANNESHKSLLRKNNSTPLSGTFYFLPIIFFLFYKFEFNVIIFCSLFFLLGLFADLKIISSYKLRLLFQLLFLSLLFSISQDIEINTRIQFMDKLMENSITRVLICTFFFMVLINGFNLIDGTNCLCSMNFLIISIFIYFLIKDLNINYISFEISILILSLLIFLIFNFFGKNFLGDGAAYGLGFLFGYILVKISLIDKSLSPYFIANLFWYPAFENLFSIIRRNISNKNNYLPDNNHLHQLIFKYLKQKNFIKQNYLLSSIVGLFINLFLLIKYSIGYIYYSNTILQVVLILFGVSCYLIFYFYLIKKIK